jgi:hypothetical protein
LFLFFALLVGLLFLPRGRLRSDCMGNRFS